MKTELKAKQLKRALRESHERQFKGEDYQAVAIDLAHRYGASYESDEYTELMSGPAPGCECGFCATAPWED